MSDLQQHRKRAEETEKTRLSDADIPDGLETTDDIEVINAKIEAIDVQELARTLADEWDTSLGRDPPRSAASWHNSHHSGTSCFATKDKWVDLAEGRNGGGPLKMIARDRGLITHSSQNLRGEDYWKAVNELRKEGYDIPRFKGVDGKHPDVLGLYDEPESEEEEREQFLNALKLNT